MKSVIAILVVVCIIGYVNSDITGDLNEYQNYKTVAQVLGFVERLYKEDKIISVTYAKSMNIYANITVSQGSEQLGQTIYNYANDILKMENLNVIQEDLINMANACQALNMGLVSMLTTLTYEN